MFAFCTHFVIRLSYFNQTVENQKVMVSETAKLPQEQEKVSQQLATGKTLLLSLTYELHDTEPLLPEDVCTETCTHICVHINVQPPHQNILNSKSNVSW
jgi:hypothetical protein